MKRFDTIALATLLALPAAAGAQEAKGYAPAAEAAGVLAITDEASAELPEGGKVMVGNATVTQADIPSSNGIIHLTDTVLLP